MTVAFRTPLKAFTAVYEEPMKLESCSCGYRPRPLSVVGDNATLDAVSTVVNEKLQRVVAEL